MLKPELTGDADNAQRILQDGLCATCNCVTGCMHLIRASQPIRRCADFDDGGTARPVGSVRLAATATTTTVSESRRPGLCGNCAHDATCTLPRGEGGVWHCEEYL